ncbi:helix-turn-helix domain-containing protein [Reyranella sp.]|uniref:helix-turn-helix domain-containing protein n=1 Tax=Reyranella sp. TaxID=1929291 RepID=UPI00272FE52F|nr:helix-turn-helix domain-containing protein [Reyranella sp.]MDP2374265.1 helix-turn-helix domain-containing protein [Reyranella sp.]
MATSAIEADGLTAIIQRALNRDHSPWLDTKGAAAYLKSTPGTLKTWRATGDGPRFHGKHRFVRYHVTDLDAFMRGEDPSHD